MGLSRKIGLPRYACLRYCVSVFSAVRAASRSQSLAPFSASLTFCSSFSRPAGPRDARPTMRARACVRLAGTWGSSEPPMAFMMKVARSGMDLGMPTIASMSRPSRSEYKVGSRAAWSAWTSAASASGSISLSRSVPWEASAASASTFFRGPAPTARRQAVSEPRRFRTSCSSAAVAPPRRPSIIARCLSAATSSSAPSLPLRTLSFFFFLAAGSALAV
mmetsp:Transcript_27367/g.82114  ORF Transcript_27367/g.82114 Transcript_27367/m.82114 type:complete len:219 (+) Transcript_27367:257-913(+)